ncbi:IS5 family transposase ISMac22 [Capnocytophaga canimorsus]|nr:IS5 family transposase ISMac22 [Capnocytophaga canimorsus]
MLLIGMWNNLSDVKVEKHVNDSLSTMKFCGMQLEDNVPSYSVLNRFRTELTEKKAFDSLLSEINHQLEKHRIIIHQGVKVDASITQSSFHSKKPKTFEIAQDRKEDELSEEEIEKQEHFFKEVAKDGVDKEARWLKKGTKTYFGYKKQIAVDSNGLVLAVHTTAANEHDSKGLIPLLEKIDNERIKKGIFTDKGYASKANREYLKGRKSKDRIQHKAQRNKPLSKWERVFNKLISKKRWVVERTFGSQKRWFGVGQTRLKGLDKVHTQHILEAIAYNLKRSPKMEILPAF